MKKLTAFWRTCDRLVAAATMREWELEIRDTDTLAVARQLLIPTDRESAWYPCVISPRCGCSHEIYTHKDGEKVAVCACDEHDCYTFPVSTEDLVVYELDFGRVFRTLAKVMGFDLTAGDTTEPRSVQRIGEFRPSPGCSVPVYFVRYVGAGGLSGIIHNRALEQSGAFVVITFTLPRQYLSALQIADHYGVMLLSLEELVFGNADGTPGVDTRVRAVVDAFTRKAAAETAVASVRSALADDVFVARNDYHTIILRGKELPLLSDLQADAIRILHGAAKAGTPVMAYAEIACRISDLHPDERGFEPPAKMSQIFRSGDPRSELVATTRPGYYRLNI